MSENEKLCSLMYSAAECESSPGDNCEWKLENHVNQNSADFPNKPISTDTCNEEPTTELGVCTHRSEHNTNCNAVYKCKHYNFEKQCNGVIDDNPDDFSTSATASPICVWKPRYYQEPLTNPNICTHQPSQSDFEVSVLACQSIKNEFWCSQ